MRVLLAGSRGWKDPDPVNALIAGLDVLAQGRGERLVIIHGDAPGLDKLAGRLGKQWGAEVIPVPARWDDYGRAAGPIRNQVMIDDYNPEAVYCFRASGKSNGTDDMFNKAKKAGLNPYMITGGNHPEEDAVTRTGL
jgi:hypothetical protein